MTGSQAITLPMVNRFALMAHSKDWKIKVASYVSEFAYSPLPLHIFLAHAHVLACLSYLLNCSTSPTTLHDSTPPLSVAQDQNFVSLAVLRL